MIEDIGQEDAKAGSSCRGHLGKRIPGLEDSWKTEDIAQEDTWARGLVDKGGHWTTGDVG